MNDDFTGLLAIVDQRFERLTKRLSAKFGGNVTKERVIWAHSRVLRQGRDVEDPDFSGALTQAVLDAVASNVEAKALSGDEQ